MKQHRMFIVCLIVPAVFVVIGCLRTAQSREKLQTNTEVREEFHQTYPLNAGGRISLENINGAVRVTTWERNEVKVDAIKHAYSPERLQEAQIVVEAATDAVRIKTKYPYHSLTFTDDERERHKNPASVEYTLTVPRAARLDRIELVNGAFDVENMTGDVKASSVNGHMTARNLAGDVKLTTVNGMLEASFNKLAPSKNISLDSVNSEVVVTLPSDVVAQVKASTVNGGITNDFNLPVKRGRYIGSSLAGALGASENGARIKISNVNGRINIRHAADGRPLSPATNLLPQRRGDEGETKFDDLDARLEREISQAAREAQRAAEIGMRDVQRNMERVQTEMSKNGAIQREIQRTLQQNAQQLTENAARMTAEMAATFDGAFRRTGRETKSFQVSGTPTVYVNTFDGAVRVRAWDKQEVSFEASKRAKSDDALRNINVRAEQKGNEISIIAEYDKGKKHLRSSTATTQFEVFVPRQANVRVVSGDGRINIEDVSGQAELKTSDGRIEVRGGRGRIVAETGDGRISVFEHDGAVEAKTGDGRITLEGRFTNINARTGDGNISITLPSDTKASIEVESRSEVVNEGFEIRTEAGTSSRPKRLRIGRGESGNLFTVRTGDGQIILRRSDGANAKAN